LIGNGRPWLDLACARSAAQDECRDPSNRRFHAQTQCCPACGPQLLLQDRHGQILAHADARSQGAIEQLRQGAILALKGVGGISWWSMPAMTRRCNASANGNPARPKPLAIMSASVAAARVFAPIGPLEQQALESTAAPIVLVGKNPAAAGLLAGIAGTGDSVTRYSVTRPHPCISSAGGCVSSTAGHDQWQSER
jgi:hydrogenase maturation protein HypF